LFEPGTEKYSTFFLKERDLAGPNRTGQKYYFVVFSNRDKKVAQSKSRVGGLQTEAC